MIKSKIVGVGHYVPEKVVTNKDLMQYMDTSDEWIVERTGIRERRWIEFGKDNCTSMAVRASSIALERAGLVPHDVDLIIFATLSPDYCFPGNGVLLQRELKMREVGAIDIRAQCSGFIYGLSMADAYIRSGICKTVLVVGSEIQSNLLDLTTRGRNISVLFGDGAGAAVLQACEGERGILSTHIHSQGEFAEQLMLREPGNSHEKRWYEGIADDIDNIYMYMNGNFVFKHAVSRFVEVINEALNANQIQPGQIDKVVPHQANLRITQFVQKTMNLREDQVYSNIHKYGNTSAATIPIALSELYAMGELTENKLVVLAAFGSGFTWASSLIRW